MLTGYTVVTTVNVGLGYGKHTAIITQEGGMDLLVKVLLINYADFALGIMSFTTPKLAISAPLNRIMNPSKFHRVWLWFLTALVFVSSSICIVVLFTMCDPPEGLWKIQLVSSGAATCRSNDILVGYAIFTGGKLAMPYTPFHTTCSNKQLGQRYPVSPTCTSPYTPPSSSRVYR